MRTQKERIKSFRMSPPLSPSCERACVPFKGITLLLIWSTLLHVNGVYFYMGEIVDNIIDMDSNLSKNRLSLLVVILLTSLFYPVAGIIAETVITRYRVMIIGTILSILGVLVLFVEITVGCMNSIDCFINFGLATYHYTFIVSFILYQSGLALFEANAIQFGVDQLQFANNDQVSKFIPWYFWTSQSFTMRICIFLMTMILYTVLLESVLNQVNIAFTVLIVLLPFLSTLTSLIIAICSKRYFITEPVGHVNPLKLIVKVLYYIGKHKQPVRRSAFTYGEVPSRLDIAKERYGGPFTTEQVEDIKSFKRILFLMLTAFGLPLAYTGVYLMMNEIILMVDHDISLISILEILLPTILLTPYFGATIVGVPVYMCFLRPCCQYYLPRFTILKRIGVGLVLTVLAMILATGIIVVTYNDNEAINATNANYITCQLNQTDSTINTLISLQYVTQIIHGIGYLIVFVSVLEFILAQSPRSMQGILIGLWYAYQSLGVAVHLVLNLNIKNIGCNYWPFIAKTAFAALSVVIYVVVSSQYKYRQREEPSNTNYQAIIEHYTERQLNQQHIIDVSDTHSYSNEFVINEY